MISVPTTACGCGNQYRFLSSSLVHFLISQIIRNIHTSSQEGGPWLATWHIEFRAV
jgi:hypothetical protein